MKLVNLILQLDAAPRDDLPEHDDPSQELCPKRDGQMGYQEVTERYRDARLLDNYHEER